MYTAYLGCCIHGSSKSLRLTRIIATCIVLHLFWEPLYLLLLLNLNVTGNSIMYIISQEFILYVTKSLGILYHQLVNGQLNKVKERQSWSDSQ